jgi:hypothetical protein
MLDEDGKCHEQRERLINPILRLKDQTFGITFRTLPLAGKSTLAPGILHFFRLL